MVPSKLRLYTASRVFSRVYSHHWYRYVGTGAKVVYWHLLPFQVPSNHLAIIHQRHRQDRQRSDSIGLDPFRRLAIIQQCYRWTNRQTDTPFVCLATFNVATGRTCSAGSKRINALVNVDGVVQGCVDLNNQYRVQSSCRFDSNAIYQDRIQFELSTQFRLNLCLLCAVLKWPNRLRCRLGCGKKGCKMVVCVCVLCTVTRMRSQET